MRSGQMPYGSVSTNLNEPLVPKAFVVSSIDAEHYENESRHCCSVGGSGS